MGFRSAFSVKIESNRGLLISPRSFWSFPSPFSSRSACARRSIICVIAGLVEALRRASVPRSFVAHRCQKEPQASRSVYSHNSSFGGLIMKLTTIALTCVLALSGPFAFAHGRHHHHWRHHASHCPGGPNGSAGGPTTLSGTGPSTSGG